MLCLGPGIDRGKDGAPWQLTNGHKLAGLECACDGDDGPRVGGFTGRDGLETGDSATQRALDGNGDAPRSDVDGVPEELVRAERLPAGIEHPVQHHQASVLPKPDRLLEALPQERPDFAAALDHAAHGVGGDERSRARGVKCFSVEAKEPLESEPKPS